MFHLLDPNLTKATKSRRRPEKIRHQEQDVPLKMLGRTQGAFKGDMSEPQGRTKDKHPSSLLKSCGMRFWSGETTAECFVQNARRKVGKSPEEQLLRGGAGASIRLVGVMKISKHQSD